MQPKPKPRRLFGVLLVLVAAGAAQAGQLVRFKTGFELQALSVRYEKDMVILTLEGGSEVGFPQWVLAKIQQDDSVSAPVVEGWGRNRVRSRQGGAPLLSPQETARIEISGPSPDQKKIIAQGESNSTNGRSIQVGFSMGTQPPPAAQFSGPKIGMSVWNALQQNAGGPGAQKGLVKLTPDMGARGGK